MNLRNFLLILGLLIFPISLQAEISIKEIFLDIPTYLTGPDDPNPPLWNLRVYPYPMQTDITTQKVIKTYKVVVMENDYIKVMILPEVGGKILSALDKTNNNFDFIYYNHVIKPGLIALRGAWLSGGIEWNFPTLGHTVNTYSPVSYKIFKNSDGSVACVVGTEEWVRRMKWSVTISLFPDKSYFKTTIRLFNRTLTHNNGYFWANAATHAFEDTRVIFPPTEYTYGGGRGTLRPWPIEHGKDVSWYRNTESPRDYFCAAPGDFNGAYNYEKDNGTVHYASGYESPGKKFWTWGTAQSGAIWEKLLTDVDGQYIEIQAGRLLTQGDTWIFEPHLVEQWEEYWYPVKKMHGFVKANPEAAVNLEIEDKKIRLALNTTSVYKEGQVRLFCREKIIFQEKMDIAPYGFYSREIPVEEKGRAYKLEFTDKDGREILIYSTEKPKVPAPELQPSFSNTKSESAEINFLQGYYSLKHWDDESAIFYFERALEKDPGYSPASRWLGILFYRRGKIERALDLFEKVLKRDEDDHTARYYRALCKINLGIEERTKEDLHIVSRRAAFRHVAPYVLASLEIKDKNFPGAESLLESVCKINPEDNKAKVMLAAVERHKGNKKEAEKLLESALKDDPLDPLALIEKKFLQGQSELEILRDDPEYFLEVASDYAEMNLLEDAVSSLKLYLENPKARPYPIVFYYLGNFNGLLGRNEEAQKYLARASALNPDYVFPFRVETKEVMNFAIEQNPSDWKARYYLGNLLVCELRWQEGLEQFLKASESLPRFSVLYRNLGEIYWKKLRDYKKAEEMYEKAVAFSPEDYRLYLALDELYAIHQNQGEREKLYRQAPEKVKNNFNLMLGRAQFFVDTGQYDEALSILKKNTFLPWEGWTGAREIYVLAHLKRALLDINKGKYRQALKDIARAQEYPENLGTGRPAHPDFTKEFLLSGLCQERIGNNKEAESFFKKIAGSDTPLISEQSFCRALALRKLGRPKEAEELMKKIKAECENLIEHTWNPSPSCYLLASLACRSLGEGEQASKYFKKFKEIIPSRRGADFLMSLDKIFEF